MNVVNERSDLTDASVMKVFGWKKANEDLLKSFEQVRNFAEHFEIHKIADEMLLKAGTKMD